jgi:hypothetical protein
MEDYSLYIYTLILTIFIDKFKPKEVFFYPFVKNDVFTSNNMLQMYSKDYYIICICTNLTTCDDILICVPPLIAHFDH